MSSCLHLTDFTPSVQRSNGHARKRIKTVSWNWKSGFNKENGKEKWRDSHCKLCQREQKSQPRMGTYLDKAGNEAVRHKEHQSDRLTELLVPLCQARSDQGQKQYYRAVGLSKKKNNSCCVPKPLEHHNSWAVGGLSVAHKGVLLINFLSAFPRNSRPPSFYLLLLPDSNHSFYFHPFSFLSLQAFSLCPMLFCVPYYP